MEGCRVFVKPFISTQPLGEIQGLPVFPVTAGSTLPARAESGSSTMTHLLPDQTEELTALRHSEKRFRAAFHQATHQVRTLVGGDAARDPQ